MRMLDAPTLYQMLRAAEEKAAEPEESMSDLDRFFAVWLVLLAAGLFLGVWR